ncbi:MAG: hypothetical protein ACOVQE_11700 [Chitinophagaceae bacterium]
MAVISELAIQRLLIDWYYKIKYQTYQNYNPWYTVNDAGWENDLALTSLEKMQLAAHANSFFNVFGQENPPYLLSLNTLREWIAALHSLVPSSFAFQSSGTGGIQKTTTHSVEFLNCEVTWLAELHGTIEGIISYVPAYSIYGFLFTVLLPQYLHVPVYMPHQIPLNCIQKNHLIVASPFHWQQINLSLANNNLPCKGVSAADYLLPELFIQLQQKQIVLVEIYGSTETAGIAYKKAPQQSFTLFPYWQKHLSNGNEVVLFHQKMKAAYNLPDDLLFIAENNFFIEGRKDKAVNIAGNLVHTQQIEKQIETIEEVQSCKITTKKMVDLIHIQAFIVLKQNAKHQEKKVIQQIKNLLPAYQAPTFFNFE